MYKNLYVQGEKAIKPYFYARNGLLHVRYTVDRCMELSPSEVEKMKEDFSRNPSYKQKILEELWAFLEKTVNKTVYMNGLEKSMEVIGEQKSRYGQQN